MNNFLIERKTRKRKEKVDYYSAILLVIILAAVVAVLEIGWVINIYGI